jgi:hypothetical protein
MKKSFSKTANGNYKVNTFVPVFNGYYDSIFEGDSVEENEMEYFNEQRLEAGKTEIKDYELFKFDLETFYKETTVQIENIVSFWLKKLGFITTSRFQKLSSPKEYNFYNDSIWVDYELTKENIGNIKKYLKSDIDKFQTYLDENYIARDGFIPYYSTYLGDWLNNKALFDSHQLGAILNFILLNEEYSENDIYEELEVNVELTNYDELWNME